MYATPNSEQYVRYTIYILKQFKMEITAEQKQVLLSCKTREEVDRMKRQMIKNFFDEYKPIVEEA